MPLHKLVSVTLFLASALITQAQLRVPASTAYLEPQTDGARVSNEGVTRWTDPGVSVSWFGQLAQAGDLGCQLEIVVPSNSVAKLKLSLGDVSRDVTLQGNGKTPVIADFGQFPIRASGYHKFTLNSLATDGKPVGTLRALLLSGSPTNQAHFNLLPRRNAASVHLAYPVGSNTNITAFYCEMTGLEDPLYTYYMACGWHRGYLGMQVNSAKERRIIFSVWDSGNEAVDRKKVGESNRVKLLAKGAGVISGDFGNEGTGGHSHWVYPWKTGERQRFLVTARATNTTHTVYSGYYYHPERHEWMLISSWDAPKDGGLLRGLYSFSENFGGENGHKLRKARYGNQWIRKEDGSWIELTQTRFSHDATGKADRRDRFMGIEDGEFFLSHGGFVPGFTKAGERFQRPPIGQAPNLPDPLPAGISFEAPKP